MRRSVLLAAFALAVLASPAAPSRAQGIAFSEGRPFAEALRRARAEKKPILLDAYAVWCGPCKQLDQLTFADPKVGEWARKKVVAVKLDAEKGEGRRISQRYAVRAFPTVLFIDPAGNEIDRLSGVFGPEEFLRAADLILAGKAPLAAAVAQLKVTWDPALAGGLAAQLAQRNDLGRLRPIALRAVEEDPSLAEEGAREAFLYLVSLEHGAGALSAETLDLIESLAPRLAADPRAALLHLAAAEAQARAGNGAAARASALAGLKLIPEDAPLAVDLHVALAAAERAAGKPEAALAAARRAVALGEKAAGGAWGRASRLLALAETLAFARQAEEAKKTLDVALATVSNDPALLVRASALLVRLKDHSGAVARARSAVEASQGGDARAQAALGEALAASGDVKGAVAAFGRAVELEPENRDARRRLDALRGRTAKKPA